MNELIAEHFTHAGFDVGNVAGFGISRDIDMTRLPPAAIAEATGQMCDPDADALLISCTSMRATTVIDRIESIIGRPVVGGNQALAWRLAGLLGCRPPESGLGRLPRSGRAAHGRRG